jgi:hypothetical protein
VIIIINRCTKSIIIHRNATSGVQCHYGSARRQMKYYAVSSQDRERKGAGTNIASRRMLDMRSYLIELSGACTTMSLPSECFSWHAAFLRNVSTVDTYRTFSRICNGYVTLCIAVFGLIGNALLIKHQLTNRTAGARLRVHLVALCIWDLLLLISCLCSYSMLSLVYSIPPLYGISAYLLYAFQPIGSMAVTGTVWQVLSITIERWVTII